MITLGNGCYVDDRTSESHKAQINSKKLVRNRVVVIVVEPSIESSTIPSRLHQIPNLANHKAGTRGEKKSLWNSELTFIKYAGSHDMFSSIEANFLDNAVNLGADYRMNQYKLHVCSTSNNSSMASTSTIYVSTSLRGYGNVHAWLPRMEPQF